MSRLLFGTGGVPHSARQATTISGIERVHELGLGCMELEFVQGVRMSEEAAYQVAETAARTDIKLSAHAPYFINLNAREPEKIGKSKERILKTAHIASLCGAQSIVFHAAFYLGDPAHKTYQAVKKHLAGILNQLKSEHNEVWLRPEVTGKPSQFGTIEEILDLCSELEELAPCLDFAHWHARTGESNSYSEFASVLKQVEQRLGRAALDNMHIHLSGIRYGKKGELSHLNLRDSDLKYPELLQALKDHEVKGLVICESPSLEEDAQLLQTTYQDLT
ncbi:TIM barrel protein [Chloroflexota bacterium]